MYIPLLAFQNVNANGQATLDMRNLLGYTVKRLTLALGGTAFTKAMLTDIKLKANGKVFFEDTGSDVDARMQYRGIAASANFLTIDFSELKAKSIDGEDLGAMDTTFGVTQLTGEFQIAGATAPTLAGYAEVGPPQVLSNGASAPGRGLLAKVLSFNHYFGAAGTFPLDIPYGKNGGAIMKRIHLFHAGQVTGAQVKKNGIVIFDDNGDAAANEFSEQEYGMSPQADLYTIDWIKSGNLSDALNTANASTMQYNVTVNAAGNVNCVVELLDALANN